jgi:hypothetical protein
MNFGSSENSPAIHALVIYIPHGKEGSLEEKMQA